MVDINLTLPALVWNNGKTWGQVQDTLSHYGAKEKDCPPVEAANEPKSHAANLEGWKGVHRVELSNAYPRGCRHSPLDDNHCQPLLELSTKRGILGQEPCWPLIMPDYYLTGNRWMTASQIFGLSTIDNKRLQTCFQVFRLFISHFRLRYLNSPFHCLSFA